jgi:hypothetical protein
MLFGLGDGLLELSPISLALSVAWLFIVILMILNLLIGIICDLFGDATKERAAVVFWTKRLAFVTDMDWVVRGPWRRKVSKLCQCCRKNKDEQELNRFILQSGAKPADYPSRKIWARFIRWFGTCCGTFTTFDWNVAASRQRLTRSFAFTSTQCFRPQI